MTPVAGRVRDLGMRRGAGGRLAYDGGSTALEVGSRWARPSQPHPARARMAAWRKMGVGLSRRREGWGEGGRLECDAGSTALVMDSRLTRPSQPHPARARTAA